MVQGSHNEPSEGHFWLQHGKQHRQDCIPCGASSPLLPNILSTHVWDAAGYTMPHSLCDRPRPLLQNDQVSAAHPLSPPPPSTPPHLPFSMLPPPFSRTLHGICCTSWSSAYRDIKFVSGQPLSIKHHVGAHSMPNTIFFERNLTCEIQCCTRG